MESTDHVSVTVDVKNKCLRKIITRYIIKLYERRYNVSVECKI